MQPTPATPLDEPERADPRDLRSMVADGVFFSAMVGLGETYVPAFALAVGLGDVVAGLVATVPMLAGALFQLITPWAVRRLRSYRRWVVACALMQAASFGPLVVGALLGRISIGWLGFAMAAYWGFGMATSPAWNAWVTSLVPRDLRAHFFAGRTRAAQASLFVAVLFGGVLLQSGRGRDAELTLFALLFATAMAMRGVSAWFLSRQSEAPGVAAGHRALPPREVFASIRSAGSGRVVSYLLCMQVAVHVAAPYFTPYMLGPLALDYTEFMALTAAAFGARVVVLPLLGQVAHRRGARLLLWWGALGIAPLPALWLLSQNFWYLLALQLFSGTAWAALELATLLSFFEGIDERDRASVLAVFNLVNATAVTIGAALGSQLFLRVEGPAVYLWLFGVSSVLRLLTLFVLRRAASGVETHAELELRTLAVRPSAGAIDRPILATVHTDEDEAAESERP